MKKTIITLSLLATTAQSALAESVDVTVVGTITPAACTPLLGGGGVIDYGSINPANLDGVDYTTLPERQIPISVTCDAPAKVALQAKTMRPNTTAGTVEGTNGAGPTPVMLFGSNNPALGVVGLGMDGDDMIGGYALRLVQGSVSADNAAVSVLYQNSDWGDQGLWRVPGDVRFTSLFQPNIQRLISWGTEETATPISFKLMTGTIGVQAYINKVSELDISKPITLDGMTTIDLVYL